MNKAIELIFILSRLLSFLAATSACLLLFINVFLDDRLHKPGYVKHMRKVCCVASVLIVILIVLNSILLFGLFFEFRIYQQPTLSCIIIDWASILVLGAVFFPYYRYFLKHTDDNIVIVGWLMKRFFALRDKGKQEQAYEYLHKASEYQPDSVFIWSKLAFINERYFNKPELADAYLAKAKQVLHVSENPSCKDKAIFEISQGDILFCRDSIDEGLTHFKKAYDIDPCDYTKRVYEDAIKWASEDDEPEGRDGFEIAGENSL